MVRKKPKMRIDPRPGRAGLNEDFRDFSPLNLNVPLDTPRRPRRHFKGE